MTMTKKEHAAAIMEALELVEKANRKAARSTRLLHNRLAHFAREHGDEAGIGAPAMAAAAAPKREPRDD